LVYFTDSVIAEIESYFDEKLLFGKKQLLQKILLSCYVNDEKIHVKNKNEEKRILTSSGKELFDLF